MKNNTLKKVTIILLILLISLASFVGIYAKNLNRMKNIMPDYKVGMDFGEIREIRLDIAQDKQTNPEEILNEENYIKSKKIIEKRMEMFRFSEYQIRQDENGYIVIQTYDDDLANNYMQIVAMKGLLQIKDNETNEVIFNNNDIKSAQATVHTERNNYSAACLVLELKDGLKEKLEEISRIYVESENNENETAEENSTNEATTKELAITFDSDNIVSAHFDDEVKQGNLQILSDGKIQIPLNNPTTSQTTLYQYLNEATLIERLINIGNLPIEYEISNENIFSSVLRQEVIQVLAIAVAILIVIAVAYLIIRYKKGLLMGASWLGFIATYLIVLRFTNSVISMNSIIGIAIICIFEYLFLNAVLHNKHNSTFNKILANYSIIGIPMYIIAIAFSFASIIPVSSFGIVLFWGSALMPAYNFIITKNLYSEE